MAWDGEESFGKMRCVSWTHLPLEQLESSGCDSVSQGLANYCLWPKSGLLPAFVHKALLKHSKSIHLHIIYDCFHAIGISGLQSLKYLLSGPFKKKKNRQLLHRQWEATESAGTGEGGGLCSFIFLNSFIEI